MPLHLLDTVALLDAAEGWTMDNDRSVQLVRGQVGTVVETRDDAMVVVEFAGLDGQAYALSSVAAAHLLKLHHDKPASRG